MTISLKEMNKIKHAKEKELLKYLGNMILIFGTAIVIIGTYIFITRTASASIKTTATVPETHLNSTGWDKVRYRDGFIYYKL